MDAFTEEGALLADTYGLKLLRYLTTADEADLINRLSGNATLEDRVEAVLSPLIMLARQAAAAATAPNAAPIRFHLDFLGHFQPAMGTSLGTALRIQAGGTVPSAVPDDPITGPLVLMLRDVFPLMLLPDDPWFPSYPRLTTALFRHPQRPAFEAAISADRDLAALFPPTLDTGHKTRPPTLYRSTGSAGTTQLELLSDLLLGAAWSRARTRNRDDIVSVSDDLALAVDIVRRAARGDSCEVPVIAAFTGLLLEEEAGIELPYGTLRPIADHERSLAPPSIEGKLSHTIAEGDTVVVSYAGDLILETTVPYRLRAIEDDFDTPKPWPNDLRGFDEIQRNLDNTRLAALLAGKADAPLALIPTWRMTLDPLNFGPMVSWNDPRAAPSFAPRRMTRAGATQFLEVATAIYDKRRPDFDVAVRRAISGMTSRGDPSDALVDLVIAWENLFGSSTELRFRISAAIAWILGSDAGERARIQREAANIYDRRSEILHGSAPGGQEVQDSLAAAREITTRLLRVLLTDRLDVLSLTSGSARSRQAILTGEHGREGIT